MVLVCNWLILLQVWVGSVGAGPSGAAINACYKSAEVCHIITLCFQFECLFASTTETFNAQ